MKQTARRRETVTKEKSLDEIVEEYAEDEEPEDVESDAE